MNHILMKFLKIAALVTVTYTLYFFYLMFYAASAADPTNGGISRSEVLEGRVFGIGGLETLLFILVLLWTMLLVSGVYYLINKKNRHYH